jgi:hypothetical protein
MKDLGDKSLSDARTGDIILASVTDNKYYFTGNNTRLPGGRLFAPETN